MEGSFDFGFFVIGCRANAGNANQPIRNSVGRKIEATKIPAFHIYDFGSGRERSLKRSARVERCPIDRCARVPSKLLGQHRLQQAERLIEVEKSLASEIAFDGLVAEARYIVLIDQR